MSVLFKSLVFAVFIALFAVLERLIEGLLHRETWDQIEHIAIPFSLVDTIETGRVYVFSRQFLEELPQRFTGPGRLRFILQPMIAIVLGIGGGLADAKAGKPPYLFGLLFHAGRRRELLRSTVAAIRNLLAVAIVLDIVFQLILYHSVHPGAALVVGPILICIPYAVSRALTMRLARAAATKKIKKDPVSAVPEQRREGRRWKLCAL